MSHEPREIARVSFDWQPGEHAEVVQILSKAQFSTGGWRAAKWAAGLVLGGMILNAAYQAWAWGDITYFFALLPWTLFAAFWYFLFRSLSARSAHQTTMNLDVNYPIEQRFTEAGLEIHMASSTLQLRWEGMTKVTEEPAYFLYYWNSRCAYYTPKRALSIDLQNQLRNLATQRLDADAHVGPLLHAP